MEMADGGGGMDAYRIERVWAYNPQRVRSASLSWADNNLAVCFNDTITIIQQLPRQLYHEPGLIEKIGQDVGKNRLLFFVQNKFHNMYDIASVSVSNTGLVAAGDVKGNLKLYELDENTKTRPTDLGEISGVSISPDGGRVASCGQDGYVRVFDVSSGERLASADHCVGKQDEDGKQLVVTGVSFSPDGGRVASCGEDGYVRVFDALSGDLLASAEHGGGDVNGVSFSPDGGRVASCGNDGYVRVFDASSGELQTFAKHGGDDVLGVSFSPNSRYVASCGSDGYVRVFDALSGDLLASAKHGGGPVWGVSFSPNSLYVASCGYDGCLKVFAASPHTNVPKQQGPRAHGLMPVAQLALDHVRSSACLPPLNLRF